MPKRYGIYFPAGKMNGLRFPSWGTVFPKRSKRKAKTFVPSGNLDNSF